MKHSLLALTTLSFAVSALKLPFRQTKRASFDVPTLNARSSAGQIIGLKDNQDLIYLVNITIDGQPHTLQLDTGSSDLWIAVSGTVPGKPSNLNVNLTYGAGFAAGPICTADVNLASFDIKNQAFMAATQVNNPALGLGADGILGVGLDSLSSIDMAVNQTGGSWGRTMLSNIFAQNTDEPNFVTMMLERENDPNNTQAQGVFTIGEYDPRFAGVANTAPIRTFPEQAPSRWSVMVDELIVNGSSIPLSSAVSGVPSSKAIALLDSGTSLVYAPADIVSAMYGNLPGAQFSNSLGQWIVPCDAEVDISVVFGKRQFDMHPLDTVQPTSKGSQTCTGSWLPNSISFGNTEFDYLFGDVVMRSLYTVYNYGTFQQNNQISGPSIQLWSLVNGSAASKEFEQLRGGISQSHFLSNDNVNAPANGTSSSTDSSSTDSSSTDVSDLETKVHNILKWAPLAIGVAVLNVVVMLVVLIVSIIGCVRRRRNDRSIAPSGSYVPLPLGASSHNYRPVSLQETKYNSNARYSD